MSKSKGQQTKTDKRAQIMAAALDVASHAAWEFVSMLEIAEAAGLSVDEIEEIFPTKKDIVRHIVSEMDQKVLKGYKLDPQSSKRDTLFDILMERFDAMNEHQTAHASFIKSFGWNTCEKISDLNFYFSSLENYMEVAAIETRGLKGLANVLALGAGYGWVLFVWMGDQSPDRMKTMATLDKTLGRLQGVAEYIGL